MRWIVLAIALLFSTRASAQCSGVFPNQYFCGNQSGAPNAPTAIPIPSFTSAQLDGLCSTNNDFLLRTAGIWGCGSTLPWSSITSTPTTIAGYGITNARTQLATSQTYYVNGDNTNPQTCGTGGGSTCNAGSDSNNCLTPATACLTTQHIINALLKSTDFAGFTAQINGAHCTGANCTNYAFNCEGGPWLGTSVVSFTGDSNAATAVKIIPTAGGNGVAVKDGCTVGLSFFAFADNATNNAGSFITVGLGNYGHVDISTVSFGPCTICVGTQVTYSGSVTFGDSGSGSTGNKPFEFLVGLGGVIDFASSTYAGSSSLTYTAFAEITGDGIINATPSTFTGFSGVTGARCIIYGPYDFVQYNPNQIFPGNADCVPIVHGGAEGLPTGSGVGSSYNYGIKYAPMQSGGNSTTNDTWGGPVIQLSPVLFTNLASPQTLGMIAVIQDGLAGNCADGTCTTWGTNVTGGTGALKLMIWWNNAHWTLYGK